jgi:deoxyribodipyrimidine photolyase-related protein
MRFLYIYHYDNLNDKYINDNHYNRITNWNIWYKGLTNIYPIDNEIKKCLNNCGYSHHIIRLMIFLNFFILLKIHPDDIYKWFMEIVSLDAYEWIMKTNIYCLGYFYKQSTRKLYISSSNYIISMSDYKKDEWCSIWNNLFYNHLYNLNKNKELPPIYYRNLMYFNNKSHKDKKDIILSANNTIKSLL